MVEVSCLVRFLVSSVQRNISPDVYGMGLGCISAECFSDITKHAHMIYSIFFRSKIDYFLRKFFYIFLIFAQNIGCGYTLEPPRRGGSNVYPQSMF